MPGRSPEDHITYVVKPLVCNHGSLHKQPKIIQHHILPDQTWNTFFKLYIETTRFIFKQVLVQSSTFFVFLKFFRLFWAVLILLVELLLFQMINLLFFLWSLFHSFWKHLFSIFVFRFGLNVVQDNWNQVNVGFGTFVIFFYCIFKHLNYSQHKVSRISLSIPKHKLSGHIINLVPDTEITAHIVEFLELYVVVCYFADVVLLQLV